MTAIDKIDMAKRRLNAVHMSTCGMFQSSHTDSEIQQALEMLVAEAETGLEDARACIANIRSGLDNHGL